MLVEFGDRAKARSSWPDKRPPALKHGRLGPKAEESQRLLARANRAATGMQNRDVAPEESHIPPNVGWRFFTQLKYRLIHTLEIGLGLHMVS